MKRCDFDFILSNEYEILINLKLLRFIVIYVQNNLRQKKGIR